MGAGGFHRGPFDRPEAGDHREAEGVRAAPPP